MFNPNYFLQQSPRPQQWALPPHLIHLLKLKQLQQIQSHSQFQLNQGINQFQQNAINNCFSQLPGQINPFQVKQEANMEKSLLQELSRQQQLRMTESSNMLNELLGQKKQENSESTASENEEISKNNASTETSRKPSTDTPKAKEYQELFQSLHQMLQYLAQNADSATIEQLNSVRDNFCKNNDKLLLVWNALIDKYRNAEKTKEEMTKFVLRKSLKFMREQCWKVEGKIKKDENKKSLDDIFFQTYFDKETFEQIVKSRKEKDKHGKKKGKIDQVETLQDLIMPFRKKSVIKTMNNEFLKQIFSFEKFSFGFLKFISHYMVVALKDNAKKINNTARKINNSLKTFKRIPWLQSWINKSEKVAEKFIRYITKQNFVSAKEIIHKRIKKDLAKFENRKRSSSL